MGDFKISAKYPNVNALAAHAFLNNEPVNEVRIIRRVRIIAEIVQMDRIPTNKEDKEIAARYGVSSDRVRALARALYWA
jgi:hypothetical protein